MDHILVARYFIDTSDNSKKETYHDLKRKDKEIRTFIDKHKDEFTHIDRKRHDYHTFKATADYITNMIDKEISRKKDITSTVRLYKDQIGEMLNIAEDLDNFHHGRYVPPQMPDFSAQRAALDDTTATFGASLIGQREQQRRQQEEQE